MYTQPKHNATRPQKPAPQLRHETKIPYLNSYANAANETAQCCSKTRPSYGHASPSDAQTAPNRPQNTLSQLRHETRNPYLNSYANAANETTSSYEKSVSSYDSGRIPSCNHPQTRLQTALSQLRHETRIPYLNSYANAANETTSSYEKSVSSYDSGRIPSCDHPQTRAQTAPSQLRHETTNPKLNSYGHETNKTTVTGKVALFGMTGATGFGLPRHLPSGTLPSSKSQSMWRKHATIRPCAAHPGSCGDP